MPTMRAAVYRGVDRVEVDDVPIPEIGPREALVRIAACGVCGTDLKKIHLGLVPPPRIFGHEMAGTIASLGTEVKGWREGDRVAVMHHVPCMECHYCARQDFAQCPVYKRTGTTAGFEPAGGGFAQYIRVMDWVVERGMVRVPPDVSFEEASFIEPVNTCLKGVRRAGIRQGDVVAVIGQGQIGLIFTQLCVLAGARVVAVDPLEHRRSVALKYGATAVSASSEELFVNVCHEMTGGRGADAAIVAVPDTSVIESAMNCIRPGGRVLLFAQTRLNDPLQADAGAVCMLEKSLIGSYSSDIHLQDESAACIFERRIDVAGLISHRFDLNDAAEAISMASAPREQSLKIVVTA